MSEEAAAPPTDAPAEGADPPVEGEAPLAEGEAAAPPVFPSENPVFTLFYFNVKALAEPIRFLFAYGAQEYDDVRVTRDEWPALKPTMPMGQMPVLEVDGRRVHQSISMARYIAKRVGLAGSTDWENLIIDTAVDTVNDFRLKIAVVSYEPDDEVKEKKQITLTTEVIPFYLEKLEAIVKENNGHLALAKGMLADGTEFDNSYKRRHPVIFTIGKNNVIKGWDQGLLGMCEGEKRRLIVPPELAYDDKGFDTLIPPGATLTFDCELLHINLRDEL